MFEAVRRLIQVDSLSPHGICLLWNPELIWTHVVSDAVIAICYFSIPVALAAFAIKRRDVAFKGVFWCFAAFILACGTTHILSIWTIWVPSYGLEALVKVVTAAASIVTAVLLWVLLPSALAIPSPSDMREANASLLARVRERDNAVAALREANRLLLLAEEIAQAGHWRLVMPERRRMWSSGIYKIFGLDPAQPAPSLDDDSNGYVDDDRARVRETMAAAVRRAGPFAFEARVLRPDGSIRDVSARGICELDAEGAVKALFGVTLDVTDLKQAEEALRLREHQLRTVLDNMPGLIGYWDVDLRNKLANRTYLDWYGKDPTTFFGAHVRDVIGEQAYRLNLPHIEKALAGEPQTFERRIPRREGGDRYTLASYIPDLRDGRVEGFFVQVTDISERKAAEDRLRASEAFLDRVGHVAGIGGWEINLRAETVTWSDQTRQIHEVDDAFRPTFETALDFYPPPARAMVERAFATALATGDAWDLEVPLKTAKGRSIWVRTAGEVERENDKPARVFGVFQEITERKTIEGERELTRRQLEQARAAAEAARREAEDANQAKSDFLATVSHEIRTPLNSIIGYTDMLKDSATLSDADRTQLRVIHSSGAALLTVVNDILDFSKIEAGYFKLNSRAFALKSLIDPTFAMIAGFATKKGLDFGYSIAADVPLTVEGDENRLRQILLNLLNNAVKFTASGFVELRVASVCRADGSPWIEFSVRDSGIGIADEAQARLFKRFSQAEGSISRRFGGTGLGLAISKGLVDLMGGEIGVSSDVGHGATFWFKVPLPEARDAVEPAVIDRRAASAVPFAARILVVEDVLVNQEIARSVLERAGHRVDVASNGVEAIAKIEATPYDVVFMDISMPEIDGLAATRHVRALDHPCRTVPIIAMTANVLPRQLSACEAAGMNGHVGKPFDRDELFAALHRVIGGGVGDTPGAGSYLAFDAMVADALRRGIGDAGFDRVLQAFAARLRASLDTNLFMTPRDDREVDIEEIAVAAGSLGFAHLEAVCQAAIAAGPSGDDTVGAFAQPRSAAVAALEIMEARFGTIVAGADEGELTQL